MHPVLCSQRHHGVSELGHFRFRKRLDGFAARAHGSAGEIGGGLDGCVVNVGPEKTVGGKHAPPEVTGFREFSRSDQVVEIDGLFRHGVDRPPHAARGILQPG